MQLCRSLLVGWLIAGFSSSILAGDQQGLRLDGQPNFRDLGGYKTTDGRKIKSGLVFRSGTLSRITDSDEAKLKILGIKKVVNFLTDEEIRARGSDRLPEDVKMMQLPIAVEMQPEVV